MTPEQIKQQYEKEAEELYPIPETSSTPALVELVTIKRREYLVGRLRSSEELTKLQGELDRLKIELSNYAYQIDSAKRERDKAEGELDALKKENEAAAKYISANAEIIFILENATIDSKYEKLLTEKTGIAAELFEEYKKLRASQH